MGKTLENYTVMPWCDIYQYWKSNFNNNSRILEEPFEAAEIHVPYDNHDNCFYRFDWIKSNRYDTLSEKINHNINYLLFMDVTSPGIVHTVKMLIEAQNEEEIAAIWIAAFAGELLENAHGIIYLYASNLRTESCKYLNNHFCTWHHAVKHFLPYNYINDNLCYETEYSTIYAIIDLAILNASLIRYEYMPILYTSLEKGERFEDENVRFNSSF